MARHSTHAAEFICTCSITCRGWTWLLLPEPHNIPQQDGSSLRGGSVLLCQSQQQPEDVLQLGCHISSCLRLALNQDRIQPLPSIHNLALLRGRPRFQQLPQAVGWQTAQKAWPRARHGQHRTLHCATVSIHSLNGHSRVSCVVAVPMQGQQELVPLQKATRAAC